MKAFYSDGQVYQADVLEWALWYRGEIEAGRARPFHATVTDPPYGLSEPPPIEDVLTAWLAGDKFDYSKPGFMGKSWDNLPPGPQIWRALLDVCYPGAYLFAFSSTRTADLLSIACRLGGWEPFDRISHFAWVQAQGMKKGVDIGKQLDAEAGVEREVVGQARAGTHRAGRKDSEGGIFLGGPPEELKQIDITAPATPLAKLWDGYGSGLAPKHEPVLLFRKPREGRTFAQCAREFGSGGLWVDRCRVRTSERDIKQMSGRSGGHESYGPDDDNVVYGKGLGREVGDVWQPNTSGRWPPNVHFSHVPHTHPCPACNGAGCDECEGRGVVGGCVRVGSKKVKATRADNIRTGKPGGYDIYGKFNTVTNVTGCADPDGKETVDDWRCTDTCPVAALDEMAGNTGGHPGTYRRPKPEGRAGNVYGDFGHPELGKVLNTYNEKSSNASRFYPCHDWSLDIAERLAGETPFAYVPKASRGERDAGLKEFEAASSGIYDKRPSGDFHTRLEGKPTLPKRNTHACVKPLSLTKWLAALLRPPLEYDPIICCPFAGTGSEAIGAILAGWQNVIAIEREREYCDIAAARLAWWSKWATITGKDDPAGIRKLAEAAEDAYTELRGKWASWTQDPEGLTQAIEMAEARRADLAKKATQNGKCQMSFEFCTPGVQKE